MPIPLKTISCCLVLLFLMQGAWAQSLLQKKVTLNATNRPLSEVLETIGRQGGFSFSYNSKIISARKPATIVVLHKTVQETLDKLLEGNYQYKEVAGHIILQPVNEKWYILSGYVQDATTGQAISDASVYERTQLVAANTNDKGYFRLRLRDRFPTAKITISKELYTDTTMVFTAGGEQIYNLPVRPIKNIYLDSIVIKPHSKIGDHFLGKLFLSSRQKLQDLNIVGFMATKPYQVSLVPGLGTHGSMSGQVVNTISLNVLGGYTAGTRGVEVAGLFNLSKDRINGTQVAGLFNIVGGKTVGAEVAGLYNGLADSMQGAAVAGIMNNVGGHSAGVMIAGVVNRGKGNSVGTQIAGVANIEKGTVKGVQIAGVVNYAHKVDGIQIGLVNIADSSDGYMFGLVNLSRSGYHKAVISTNEVLPFNIALKTGNRKLYVMLMSGFSAATNNEAFSFGAGIGREYILSKRFAISTEISVQHLYLGDWDYANFLYRGQPDVHFRMNKFLSVAAGPSLSIYQAKPTAPVAGFKGEVAPYTPIFKQGDGLKGWVGWHLALELF